MAFLWPSQVKAEEIVTETETETDSDEDTTSDTTDQYTTSLTDAMDEIDYSSIQSILDNLDIDKISFKELVADFTTSDLSMDERLGELWEFVCEQLFSELVTCKSAIIQILILVIASAVLTKFTDVFDKPQISGMSFYIVYMLLLVILTNAFAQVSDTVITTLNNLIDFMNVLVPVFSVVLAICAGSSSAIGFYELAVIMIYLIERVFLYFVIPLVHVYVVIVLADRLFQESYLSKMADLIKSFIGWSTKILCGFVVGMNLVQCIVSPAIDALKTNTIAKSVSALPGVGNALGSITEIMIGSGMVLKNGIGIAGMIILFIICLAPCIKLAVVSFAFKFTAAILQPVSDNRIIGSISDVGEGIGLLAKIMVTAEVLFLLQIAMITASTGWVNR